MVTTSYTELKKNRVPQDLKKGQGPASRKCGIFGILKIFDF